MDDSSLTTHHVATGKHPLACGHAIRHLAGNQKMMLIVVKPRCGTHNLGSRRRANGKDDVVGGQCLSVRGLVWLSGLQYNLNDVHLVVHMDFLDGTPPIEVHTFLDGIVIFCTKSRHRINTFMVDDIHA